ncbi:baseplate hub protein [Actinobacillus seminis]|uniref:baseplate hub protein n=1 Tax=Actinobacillus seminis TaxID=722 RepID=UPI003B94AD11
MGSFTKKKLKVTIALGNKDDRFDDKNNNVIVVEGLRISATIQSGNGAPFPTAKMMIYGLSGNVMDKLARIQWHIKQGHLNLVRLEASRDGGESYTVVHSGTINFAYPNFGSAPDSILTIDSLTGYHHQILPVKPLSLKGEVDVSNAISKICRSMGMRFENSGVTGRVSNPYLPQSALEQIKNLCDAVDANMILENDAVAIVPRGQSRKINIPVISPQSGLIGYPTPTMQGVSFQCLFDPLIKMHGNIEIKNSFIDSTNGTWHVFGLTHYLESEISGGRWLSEVDANRSSEEVKVAK